MSPQVDPWMLPGKNCPQDGRCCKNPLEAAEAGHYDCYELLPPPTGPHSRGLFKCIHRAVVHQNFEFAAAVLNQHGVHTRAFAVHCIAEDDPVALEWALTLAPDMDKSQFLQPATERGSVCCTKYLLESGVPWNAAALVYPAWRGDMKMLKLSLKHGNGWHAQVPGVAACAGNVRFLMRIFKAGCPIWTSARDGEPVFCRFYRPAGSMPGSLPVELDDWTLVVPSDLLRSGPVLLLAAKKAAPLTDRMQAMLEEVRDRAQALACCFHMAKRLGKGGGAAARDWAAIGGVPTKCVKKIATLAKISIAVRGLVQ